MSIYHINRKFSLTMLDVVHCLMSRDHDLRNIRLSDCGDQELDETAFDLRVQIAIFETWAKI